MSEIENKRSKKNELLIRKEKLEKLEKLIAQLVNANFNNIQRVLLNKKLKVNICPNWTENVLLARLDNWLLYHLEILNSCILKLFVNLLNDKCNLLLQVQDLFTIVTLYELAKEHITHKDLLPEDIKTIQFCIDITSGDITAKIFDKEKLLKCQKVPEIYKNINSYLSSPYIVKVCKKDFKHKCLNVKVNNIINAFINLEDFSEDSLCKMLDDRYLNLSHVPMFISSDELEDKLHKELLINEINIYLKRMYGTSYTNKKKAIIVNLLVLGIPYLIGNVDVNYFKNTEEYYKIYWICNNEINK